MLLDEIPKKSTSWYSDLVDNLLGLFMNTYLVNIIKYLPRKQKLFSGKYFALAEASAD